MIKNAYLIWPRGTITVDADGNGWRCPICSSDGAVRFDAAVDGRVLAATCLAPSCGRTVVEPMFIDAPPHDDWRHILYLGAQANGGPARFHYALAPQIVPPIQATNP